MKKFSAALVCVVATLAGCNQQTPTPAAKNTAAERLTEGAKRVRENAEKQQAENERKLREMEEEDAKEKAK